MDLLGVKVLRNLVIGTLLDHKAPIKIQQYITFKCNMRCNYCGLWANNIPELDTKQVKDLIDFFHGKGVAHWTFTGGEPLLRPDMGELAEYCFDKGLKVNLTTNASIIEGQLDWLKKIDLLTVSLDGPKKVHESTRPVCSYEDTVENIKKLKEGGCNVALNTVLSRPLLNDGCALMKKHLGLITDLGVKVIFLPMYVDGYNDEETFKEFLPSREMLVEAAGLLREFKSENKGVLLMTQNAISWMGSFYDRKPMKCFSSKFFLTIYPDGSLTPCNLRSEKKVSGGSIQERLDKLEMIKECPCKTNCYFELNKLLSLNPHSILDHLIEFFDRGGSVNEESQ